MPSSELVITFVSPGEVLAVGIVIPLVGILAVGLRFCLRTRQKIGRGADDYLILVALTFVIGLGICLIYGVAHHALAYPTPEGPDPSPKSELTALSPQQRLVELLDWFIWVLMIPANGFIKLSALFLYRRIFVVNKKTLFDIAIKVSIVVCSLWMVAFFFATLVGCGTHFDYPWRSLFYISMCNTNKRLDALMISDLATDIIVWLLPIPVIWNLKMQMSRKLSVIGIMLLAAVSLAAAIARLIVQLQISNGGYAAHTDVDLTLTTLLYWSMMESGLAVIAACLPTLHPLFARSSIKSAIASVRSAMSLGSTSSSRPLNSSHYSELEKANTLRPSNRNKYEVNGNVGDTYIMQDMDLTPHSSGNPMIPGQAHVV